MDVEQPQGQQNKPKITPLPNGPYYLSSDMTPKIVPQPSDLRWMENLFRIWVEQRYVNAELLNIGIIPEFFKKWFDIFFKDTCNRVPYYYSHYPFCKKV